MVPNDYRVYTFYLMLFNAAVLVTSLILLIKHNNRTRKKDKDGGA